MAKLQEKKVRVHPDDLIIITELESFNLMRDDEELRDLEDEILIDGVIRETITIWIPIGKPNWLPAGAEGKPVLVDGFSRRRIVKKHNLPIVFEGHVMDFEDIEEAKEWIQLHQQSRRNLTDDQQAYFVGMQYNKLKNNNQRLVRFLKLKGRLDLLVGPEDEPENHTATVLGKIYRRDEKTIRRNGQFARGIEIIRERNPVLAAQILRQSVWEDGKHIRVNRALVEKFSLQTPPKRIDGLLDVQEVVDSSKKSTDKYETEKEEIILLVEKFLDTCTLQLKERVEARVKEYYLAHGVSKDKSMVA